MNVHGTENGHHVPSRSMTGYHGQHLAPIGSSNGHVGGAQVGSHLSGAKKSGVQRPSTHAGHP